MVGKHVDTIVWVMFSGKDEHRGRRARLSLTASVVARNNVKAALWNSEIEAALFELGRLVTQYALPESAQWTEVENGVGHQFLF